MHDFLCIPHVFRYLQRPEKNVTPPGTRLIGICELFDVGTGI